jgi:hypothetical protein
VFDSGSLGPKIRWRVRVLGFRFWRLGFWVEGLLLARGLRLRLGLSGSWLGFWFGFGLILVSGLVQIWCRSGPDYACMYTGTFCFAVHLSTNLQISLSCNRVLMWNEWHLHGGMVGALDYSGFGGIWSQQLQSLLRILLLWTWQMPFNLCFRKDASN